MSGLVDSIIDKYNYVVYEMADPRSQDWLWVSNPLTTLSIISAYLYFCTSLGPRLMKNRKPYELKNVLLIYNALQVCLSLFIVYRAANYIFHKDYNLACQEIDYSYTPRGMQSAADSWWYFFAKITELLDTVFFVLRKKFNQVSFLHVYHHTLMSSLVWVGVKYFPGGHVYIMGFLNSIVHVIMYTYYLVSGLGPQYQKYLWWKKHVTIIQLVQFIIILAHHVYSLFFYECNYPKFASVLVCANAIAFIYMFGKFYIQSYNNETPKKTKLEAKNGNVITRNINNKYSLNKNGKEKSR